MHASKNEILFYGTYISDDGLSLVIENADPFYAAISRISGMYIISRSSIERFHGKPKPECACGLIIEHAPRLRREATKSKYIIYIAEELLHRERLITIAHELIHLVLVLQGFPLDSHSDSEEWIDGIAERFFQANPNFLNWVYRDYVRIAG